MTMAAWQALSVGDTVPLKTVLGNIYFVGVVTDPNVPNQFAATMEMFGDTAVVTVPVLQGPKGNPGEPQFALRFQHDSVPDPDSLPILTNTEADIGKYWIFKDFADDGTTAIGTSMYIWYGTSYRTMPVGSQGPAGPTPIIDPYIVSEPPGSFNGPNGEQHWVEVTSGPAYPVWTMHMALPLGPKGNPGDALSSADDVDMTKGAAPGDVLVASSRATAGGQRIWEPKALNVLMPSWYSVPEGAFQNYSGITGKSQTIATFAVPQQQYNWKPKVGGHMRIFGGNLDPTPLLVGVEVRLGDPVSGPVVATGQGNAFGMVTIQPHFSDKTNPNTAVSPENATAKVAAGHTGSAGTLYVNLVNEGLVSVFNFNAEGAQLDVECKPVP